MNTTTNNHWPLLETINSPHDLRCLTKDQLLSLARELRDFILHSVSQTGGHLASSLGSIELTIALHYVYNTPHDLLVWDVGHQTYPHKILTGRRKQMSTLRQMNGISGFPRREESVYDTFGVGHSSTSISSALGMAIANKYLNKQNKVVAIIGDGAMTAGLAFEGLNNAGWLKANMLVILNDNEMSISENVGAISHYISKVLASRFYNSVKNTASKALELVPTVKEIAHKVEEHVKGFIMPSTLFEELGFNYIGPIDGHDIDELVGTLKKLRSLNGPQLLHIITKKGQGYKLAENDPIAYHGVTKFDPLCGMPVAANKLTYTQVFGKWLCDMAKCGENFVAITPAMREGSGMVEFAKKYPHMFFDVGIAEQHALTFAAGIATQGVVAVVAIYSTFLQRGYDQLIHDIALQNLPVVFAVDRAGIAGADGATHLGAFDLSYLSCIPNLIIMAPGNEDDCYHMLYTAFKLNKPALVRYPRGSGIGKAIEDKEFKLIPLAKAKVMRHGQKIAILAFGSMVQVALLAGNELNATVCDMRFVKPLDESLIKQTYATHDYLVTIEENVLAGGAGALCMQYIQANCYERNKPPILSLGLPDSFIEHGDQQKLLALCGLNKDNIVIAIQKHIAQHG